MLEPLLVASLLVVTVLDGDTLTTRDGAGQRTTLRLAQVDAPEKGQGYWRVSRGSLLELCGNAKRIEFKPVDTDRYSRTVAQVECDGVDVNFEQVRRGLAWCFPRYVTDRRCFDIEAEAKAARHGLWSEPNPTPPWVWRQAQRGR